jgi:superfamily II DNA/RNA helicase
MVFCNTVKSTRAVDHYLNNNGIRSLSLHGDLPVEIWI